MTYRSDKDAREFRQTALEQELQEIRDALDPLAARAEILEEDLESMRRVAPAQKTASILDAAKIANPCPKDWNEMKGDDKVRFCGGCKKNVFNVIAMTRAEAEELITGGNGACMRLFRRPDGTVMTSDCAPGRWRRRGQKVAVAAAAAGLAATAAYGASRLAHEPDQQPTAGAIAVPDAYMQQMLNSPVTPAPTPTPTPPEIRATMGEVPSVEIGDVPHRVEMGGVGPPPSHPDRYRK